DAAGRVVGGACSPATAACLRDRDCSQADPLCVGDRCVCDGACRIGCRPGGVCADGAWCQPDGVCASFCRDDDSEPNDTVAAATLLPAGRVSPNLRRTGELCARSPVDWYAFSAGGQPFQARLVPLDPLPVFDFGLYDSNGALIAPAERGADGVLRVGLADPQAAAARLGQNLALRVRASGTFDRTVYRLEIDVTFPECPDPAQEPKDASWQATEILTTAGAAAAQNVDGWICPQDTDWYGMFLAPGDQVRLTLVNQGNAGGAPALLDAALVGPDWPDAGRARVLTQLPAGQQRSYTVPAMFCDPATSFCAMGDGTPTDIFCGGDDADCTGIGYFVRVRGAGAFDLAQYRLQAEVTRAQAVLCVPDLFEFNGNFQLFNRVHAAMAPALRIYEGQRPTVPIGQQVDFTRLRACGGPGPVANALDADNFMVWLNVGEQLVAAVSQQGSQRLQLDTYQVTNVITRLSAQASTDPMIVDSVDARESSFYAVAVLRAGSDGQAGYTNSTPYNLSMVRLPVGFVPDTACQDPVRVNLVNGVAEITGSTLGGNDDHRPLDCLGGEGPDRVYTVRVPAGAGVLRATVMRDFGATYDPAVSIRTDCAVANSEVACNEDDAAAVDPFAQARAQGVVQGGAAGRDVFVIVDSHSAATAGAFRLLLRYIPGDQCNLNTGVCDDPCQGVACLGGQICDPDDGQCVDCFVDGQCQFGERCVARRCVAGADREISSWGADGADEPQCLAPSDCTPDEVCSSIPFTQDDYCLLPCNENLVCPVGYRCCLPPIAVGPGEFCVPADNPLGGLCQ
ncbi:MAG: hypothetical protein KC613_09385, partial [Myxococcales bacterium]|nr:hypothetical protein [Myxococcales bacterium]